VLERKESGCRPFSEVQNYIRDNHKDQRMAQAQRKYLDEHLKNARIWTVYTGRISVAELLEKVPNTQQR
jgi:hypothetical protein